MSSHNSSLPDCLTAHVSTVIFMLSKQSFFGPLFHIAIQIYDAPTSTENLLCQDVVTQLCLQK